MSGQASLSDDELIEFLRIWLTLAPQWVRQGYASKRQDARDAAVQELARSLAGHLAKYEIIPPPPLAAHEAPPEKSRGDNDPVQVAR